LVDVLSRADVVLIHGFGEHGGRFKNVAEYLSQNGYTIHVIDLRGHGYSGGPRADGKMAWMLRDLAMVHQKVALAKKSTNTPTFFYGHSMGGLLVLRYLI